MGGAILGKGGFELEKALGGDAISNTVVRVYDDVDLLVGLGIEDGGFDGNDFVLELAGLVGSSGLLEGQCREFVLNLARDMEVGGDIFRGDAHGDEAVLGFLIGKDGI